MQYCCRWYIITDVFANMSLGDCEEPAVHPHSSPSDQSPRQPVGFCLVPSDEDTAGNTHTHTHTHIHMHTHTHIQTHVHTHTHTYSSNKYN